MNLLDFYAAHKHLKQWLCRLPQKNVKVNGVTFD